MKLIVAAIATGLLLWSLPVAAGTGTRGVSPSTPGSGLDQNCLPGNPSAPRSTSGLPSGSGNVAGTDVTSGTSCPPSTTSGVPSTGSPSASPTTSPGSQAAPSGTAPVPPGPVSTPPRVGGTPVR